MRILKEIYRQKPIFVTGIDTNVGKTCVSSILVEMLQADYWKPIQCGDLDHSDSMTVTSLVSQNVTFYPEVYRFKTPASPHLAAIRENKAIEFDLLKLPKDNQLIIEGAGGIMVPFDHHFSFLDFVLKWKLPVVIVIKSYLGCLNHTFLTLELLKQYNIHLVGVVLNGSFDKENEDIIYSKISCPVIGKMDWHEEFNSHLCGQYASLWKQQENEAKQRII